jgi:hypothetical protein
MSGSRVFPPNVQDQTIKGSKDGDWYDKIALEIFHMLVDLGWSAESEEERRLLWRLAYQKTDEVVDWWCPERERECAVIQPLGRETPVGTKPTSAAIMMDWRQAVRGALGIKRAELSRKEKT